MHCFQNICNSFLPDLCVRDILQHCLVMKIIMGGHIFVASEFLRQVTDQSLELFPFLKGVESVDPYFAVTLLEDSANYSHKRCLACPVWSKEPEHPVTYFQGYAAQSFERFFLFTYERHCSNYLIHIF